VGHVDFEVLSQKNVKGQKEAPALPTWAPTSESTCSALGEGWGYAFLSNVGAKLAFLEHLVVYFIRKL
jgi:hypothetical protein